MKKFKSFIETFKKKYIAVYFDKESTQKLRDYAINNGFDLSQGYDGSIVDINNFDFHATIFFTTSEHITPTGEYNIKPFDISISGFEFLGPNNDIPVLKVSVNDELLALRSKFELSGFKDAWPDYKPHISLSYVRDKDIKPKSLPDFKIRVNKLVVQDQKEKAA